MPQERRQETDCELLGSEGEEKLTEPQQEAIKPLLEALEQDLLG